MSTPITVRQAQRLVLLTLYLRRSSWRSSYLRGSSFIFLRTFFSIDSTLIKILCSYFIPSIGSPLLQRRVSRTEIKLLLAICIYFNPSIGSPLLQRRVSRTEMCSPLLRPQW